MRTKAKRRVFGRKAVMRVAHTDAPKSETIKRKLRPHVACKEENRRILELGALKAFRAAYASARKSWAEGVRRVKFPFGTYRLLRIGVPCAAPPSLT